MPTGNDQTPPEALYHKVPVHEEAVATEHWKTVANEQAAEVVRLYGCIDAWRNREEALMATIAQLKNPDDMISTRPPRSDSAKAYLNMISKCEPMVESVESINGHGLPIMEELKEAVEKCGHLGNDGEVYGRGDAVNSPSHYLLGDGTVECVDAIRAALSEDEYRGWCKGNAMKYIWRSNHKGTRDQDLQKCAWFSRMASGDDPREK